MFTLVELNTYIRYFVHNYIQILFCSLRRASIGFSFSIMLMLSL